MHIESIRCGVNGKSPEPAIASHRIGLTLMEVEGALALEHQAN